jgi:hypothetical protein
MRPSQPYKPGSRERQAKVKAINQAMEQTGLTRAQFCVLASVGKGTLYRFLDNNGRLDIQLGSWERMQRVLDGLGINHHHIEPPVGATQPDEEHPAKPWQR